VPGALKSVAGSVAVRSPLSTNVVISVTPLQVTVDPVVKPDPDTAIVTEELPTDAEFG
jgi:hypothetical protein